MQFIKNVQPENIPALVRGRSNLPPVALNPRMMVRPTPTPQPSVQKKAIDLTTTEPKKKMSWGQPTWLFFHTLAEKVKEESFPIVYKELLQTIYSICVNLPCPECAGHAKTYLDSHRFLAITSKQQLKQFLFQFHNVANEKKNTPLMKPDELDAKYSLANTKNIVLLFFNTFEKKNNSIRLLADDIHRQRLTSSMKQWMNTNIGHFVL
jgi:hypothetical protein